jgi:hypothetical protein
MDTSILAELNAAAEMIDDYERRVALLIAQVPRDRDDLRTAIEEAERSLGVAERAIRRAAKVATPR